MTLHNIEVFQLNTTENVDWRLEFTYYNSSTKEAEFEVKFYGIVDYTTTPPTRDWIFAGSGESNDDFYSHYEDNINGSPHYGEEFKHIAIPYVSFR